MGSRLEYAILTSPGERDNNEDSVGVKMVERSVSVVLADGLGGHDRGEIASALVKDTALELFSDTDNTENWTLQDYLKEGFQEGQKRLRELQRQRHSDMKTTMVVLAIRDQQIQWGHVGDSRLYYFKNGKLVRRTLDHSVPQMLVKTGEIKEKDIRHHEDRNRLLRVMGIEWESPKYELAEPIKAEEGQAFLLCSDGFWEWIEEKDMIRTLKAAETPEDWLKAMEKIVLTHGKGNHMDNYSAVAVFVGEKQKKKHLFGIFG